MNVHSQEGGNSNTSEEFQILTLASGMVRTLYTKNICISLVF